MIVETKYSFLDKLEDQVEGHIKFAIETFQNLNDEQLLQPAPDGGWSIAQCLEHLNGYGRYYLPIILEKLENYSGKSNVGAFKSSMLGSYFTRMMDPTTGKKKIKTFKNHIPDRELNASEVIAEFINQQEVLLKAIDKARHVDLSKIKIPISIANWLKLNLGDTFGFLIAHNERHMQQAKRLL